MSLNLLAVAKISILLFFPNVAFGENSESDLIRDPVYLKAQKLVKIENNRRLNLYCRGTGSPTVVFESGMSSSNSNWGFVQPTISKKTRTCSYDHAGIGFSDPSKRPSTSANIVGDLHRLLSISKIEPPYVLVGHSSGGLNVRLYTHTYPDEVVGMVLVDPSDENQVQKSVVVSKQTWAEWYSEYHEPSLIEQKKCIVAAKAGFVPGSELYKKCVSKQAPQLSTSIQEVNIKNEMRLAHQKASFSEYENFFEKSADQLRSARISFGDLPLIILTETRIPKKQSTPEQHAEWKAYYQVWIDLHKEQAKLSSRGINKFVPNSGHNIQLEQPEEVENAIMTVLKMVAEDS